MYLFTKACGSWKRQKCKRVYHSSSETLRCAVQTFQNGGRWESLLFNNVTNPWLCHARMSLTHLERPCDHKYHTRVKNSRYSHDSFSAFHTEESEEKHLKAIYDLVVWRDSMKRISTARGVVRYDWTKWSQLRNSYDFYIAIIFYFWYSNIKPNGTLE